MAGGNLSDLELQNCADFERQYRVAQHAAFQTAEQTVCGCDYGATSWATRDEADFIAGTLALKPGVSLLEIGAGAGWPSLYIAEQSGCDVTLTDLPAGALRIAAQRWKQDDLSGVCLASAADATQLPFREASFDTINHSDVLCCLVKKREVLAECRRVIKPTGKMVFSVIYIAPDLSGNTYASAIAAAPVFVEADQTYPSLIEETGWTILDRRDLSEAFQKTCQQRLDAEEADRSSFEALLGSAEFDARLTRLRDRIQALDAGYIRREIFVLNPASGQ